MNKGQLKSIVAALEASGAPDSAEVKVELDANIHPVNGRISLLPYPVKIEKQDMLIAPDAGGNWAPEVTQADAVVLKQG